MDNKQVTLGQLVEYVLKNRTKRAFRDYSEHHIASGIMRASDEGTLRYACEENGAICGIVVAQADDELKIMMINDILTTSKWAFKSFMNIFAKEYPGYTLKAFRNKGSITYNTPIMINKVLSKEVK